MNNDLKIYSNCIIKKYDPNAEHAEKSNLDNEMFCFNKFSFDGQNPYCPIVLRMDNLTYAIEKYSFSLGEAISLHQNNVKRMLFSISYEEFEKQINEILIWLDKAQINHRDFNPSNLIFYEKEKRIKLIDFYYSVTDGITLGTPGQLNWFYGKDDKIAAEKIKSQVRSISEEMKNVCKSEIFPIIDNIGKSYCDGSSTTKGIVYHPITIPDIKYPYVIDSSIQSKDIISYISITPESIIDIGSSVGMFTFDLIRNYHLNKAYVYEADPGVNNFLKKIKSIYHIDELEVNSAVVYDTDFPEVDVSLMLNVHMWIYKQLGKEQSDKITSQLIKKSKQMFFQTAGKESPGMFILQDKEFSSKEEIEKYLYFLGAKKVYYIKAESLHGGFRHLFKVEGR